MCLQSLISSQNCLTRRLCGITAFIKPVYYTPGRPWCSSKWTSRSCHVCCCSDYFLNKRRKEWALEDDFGLHSWGIKSCHWMWGDVCRRCRSKCKDGLQKTDKIMGKKTEIKYFHITLTYGENSIHASVCADIHASMARMPCMPCMPCMRGMCAWCET